MKEHKGEVLFFFLLSFVLVWLFAAGPYKATQQVKANQAQQTKVAP